MPIQHSYKVRADRIEHQTVEVTDYLETLVWEKVGQNRIILDITREEYEALSDEEKARYLASTVATLVWDFEDFLETDEVEVPEDCIRIVATTD